MKTRLIAFALPLLVSASCGSPNTDDANDAAGTGSPYLAREVVGVHMLSSDANYDKLADNLTEEFVRATFKLGEDTELMVHDERAGVEYHWGKNHVHITMADERPFPSVYHAEAAFNKMYQNGKTDVMGQMGEAGEKAPLSGPNPEGTGAEGPGVESGQVGHDANTANDTTDHPSGETAAATIVVKPVKDTEKGEAVLGVGDKAIWEPATETLHVLLNNHILNIKVETADKEAVKQERAKVLAQVLLANMTGLKQGPKGN
jgi:hypothetical protein